MKDLTDVKKIRTTPGMSQKQLAEAQRQTAQLLDIVQQLTERKP